MDYPSGSNLITKKCVHSLQPYGLGPTSLLCPWNFSGKNMSMGCCFLLQGIFPTQGSNPSLLCLLHCRQILYLLSLWGSPLLLIMVLLLLLLLLSHFSRVPLCATP